MLVCRTTEEYAEQIVANHNRAQASTASTDAVTAAGKVLAWIDEHHVKKHDSDTLDVDHGPDVEWDYCNWCYDHGLPEDWPCMFVQARAALAAGLVRMGHLIRTSR